MEVAVAGYAEGVLKNSLGKLGSFLLSEALLIGTVRQDIQFIRDELMTMNAVMQDLIRAGNLNQQMRTWMLQVLEVACDAELCTDEFIEKVGASRDRGFAAALEYYVRSLSTIYPRYRISKAIRGLKSRAKEVSERRTRYSATTIHMADLEPTWVTEEEDTDLIRYDHLVAEAALVGMHTDDTKAMYDKVENCEMTVIEGSAGSGKTVLARMMYRRADSRYRTAWVAVSNKPNMKRVLEEILRQLMKNPLKGFEEYDVQQLSEKLHEEFKNQWYLIFLDSLWSVEDWKVIKGALPRHEHGKVVVTTRKKDVADECCSGFSNSEMLRYEMQPLPNEQMDQLLVELLSDDKIKRINEYNWIALRPIILKACSGPLELKCICGYIAGAGMEAGRLYIMKADLNEVYDRFTNQEDRTREVLKLFWKYNLPSRLFQCSQDLSILPEGYPINSTKLKRWWMANGYIKPERGLSAEEVADSYFDELLSRCIIEPESVQPGGKIRRCRINSVFKELMTTISISISSANPVQNQQVKNPETVTEAGNQPAPDRETVNPDGNQQVPNSENPTPSKEQQVPMPGPISFQLYNFVKPSGDFVTKQLFSTKPELLTFLDLEGCKGLRNRELNKLCEFAELRFLSLKNTDVDHLPKNIGNLKLLETLDIRQTKIKTMHSGIVGLNCLKHLLAGYAYKPEGSDFVQCPKAVEMPVGINKMQSLQTLTRVDVTQASEILFALGELTQLKKLGLVISEENLNSRPLCISIMMLSTSLRSLSVCDERKRGSLDFLEYLCFPPEKLQSLNLRGNLGRLPRWVANHTHLSKITLSNTHFGSYDLYLLGGIHSLLCLKLYHNSFRQRSLVLREDEFRALRVLVVQCDGIITITFEEGATPSLEVFKWLMVHNPTGKFIYGIGKLPQLKDVSVIGTFDRGIRNQFEIQLKKKMKTSKTLVFSTSDKEICDVEDETENEATNNSGNTSGGKLLCCLSQ